MKFRPLLINLILLVLCAATPESRASHASGASLYYEYIGQSVNGHAYRIYLTFFRDCTGISEQDEFAVFAQCARLPNFKPRISITKSATLRDGRPNGSPVGRFCPGASTSCDVSGGYDYHNYTEWLYEGVVVLPEQCDSWTIYTEIDARNPSDNLHVGGSNLYCEVVIDNAATLQNNPPFFTVQATPFFCLNTPHNYNLGAVDPDGDSLSYEIVTPQTAPNRPLVFISGYSLQQPFATDASGFHLDPVTGQMRFTPNLTGRNTICIKVTEWRNGKKIGHVTRDLTINVILCDAEQVDFDLDEASVTGGFVEDSVILACEGIPLRFCYDLTSPLVTAKLEVDDNHVHSIPGSGVTLASHFTPSVKGCVSWLPGSEDVGLNFLMVNARDVSCTNPRAAILSHSFPVKIRVRPSSHQYKQYFICPGGEVQVEASYPGALNWIALSGDDESSLSCRDCQRPVASPESPTRYLSVLNLGGSCISTDTVDVNVDTTNSIRIAGAPLIGLCEPEDLTLAADALGNAPLQRLNCGKVGAAPGSQQDSALLVPTGAARPSTVGSDIVSPFNGTFRTARKQYLLRNRDMLRSRIPSASLEGISLYFAPHTDDVTYRTVRIGIACTREDSVNTASGYLPGAVQMFAADSIVIPAHGGWLNFPFSGKYNWDTARHLLIEMCYANPDQVPARQVSWYETGYDASLSGSSFIGSLCGFSPPPTLSMQADRKLPAFRLHYVEAPPASFRFEWRGVPLTEFTPSAYAETPGITADGNKMLYVSTRGKYGCVVRDSVELYVAGSVDMSRDTTICLGNQVPLLAATKYGIAYRWYEDDWQPALTVDCDTCGDTYALPEKDVLYRVVVDDSTGCTDTFRIAVSVITFRDQMVLYNNDTTVPSHTQIALVPGGAYRYEWAPGHLFAERDPMKPLITVNDEVLILVKGYTEDGCYSFDSMRVSIDNRGKLFIPNAFTPNGDGRNDAFKVANMSFQELLEFRIFNRFGDEVFTTTDISKGWDGTYLGVPQQVGTYFYVIRIRYPDGVVDFFKGDLTLIR